MSDSGLDSLAAEQAVEAKLAEAGADTIRRHTFDEAPETAAPEAVEEGTPARNELGQFTSDTPADQPDAAPPENVSEAVQDDTGDPAVQAFLKKYGGDVDKALAGAVHLQRKSGEQSNELGDLRRMVDELSTLSQTIQANQAQPQQQYVDQATVDWYDQQVVDNPAQALEWARQQNNPLLVQRGLSVWKEMDPYEASVYTNRLENQAMQAQMQQQLQAVSQIPQETKVTSALQSVLARNPHFINYELDSTLAKHPFAAAALQSATSSGDTSQIEGAIETLYSLAVGDTLQQIAQSSPPGEDTVTTQDVATPSVSDPRDPAPAPSPLDAFREAFRQESDRAHKGVWVAE